MKNLFSSLLIGVFLAAGVRQGFAEQPKTLFSPADDRRAEALVAEMMLEEKIGQMVQISRGAPLDDGTLELVRLGQVGSLLNLVEPDAIREVQRVAREESRLGIPLILGRDVVHGFRTLLPIPLAMAATWSPERVEEGSALAAREARSVGVNWTFAPMLDITRDPRWGRIAESPGEDPFLAAELARAYVRGFQGDDLAAPDRVAACVKHFAAYGFSQAGRDYSTTWVPHQLLWEAVLPPFEAALEEGAATVMTAFNDLNGVPCSGNAFLFRDILRERWGFEGFVVSDWAAMKQLIDHGLAANDREVALLAARAGVDMEMSSFAYPGHLASLVRAGAVPEAVIDEMVQNILRVKSALGLFENPYPAEGAVYPPAVTGEARAIAQRAAEESFVLLRNEEHTLPLERGAAVALIGPLADQPYEQMGTWAFEGAAEDSVSVRDAFVDLAEAGEITFRFVPGLAYSRDQEETGFAAALEAAAEADVIVFVGGEEAILSGESRSRTDLRLPGAQEALVRRLAATGKPLILVVMAGRPLVLEGILDDVDALLYAWHPGTMAGPALARVLTGAVNPSGKLPVTFPRNVGQIPLFYNHRNTGRPHDPAEWTPIDEIPVGARQSSLGFDSHYLDVSVEPRFYFGEGMSYTTFAFENAALSNGRVQRGHPFTVSVVVTNTGDRAGAEVVQLYLRDPVSFPTRPVRELRGFEKVFLEPGESRTVSFTFRPEDLAFPGPDGGLILQDGAFEFYLGADSRAPFVGTLMLD